MTQEIPKNPQKATSKSADVELRVRRAASRKYLSNCTDGELAAEFEVSIHTITDWKRRPEWNDEIKAIAEKQAAQTWNELNAMAPYARHVLQELMRDKSPSVRLKAAQAIYDLPIRKFLK